MNLRWARRPELQLCAAAVAVIIGCAALACGAYDVDAPPPRKQSELADCRGIEDLMPRFHESLKSGRTEALRTVIRDHLLEAENPAILDVLRTVFQSLARFAAEPPEEGAAQGEICAAVPPALNDGHPMCEVRRAMEVLVHEAKGLAALKLVDPQFSGIFDYILGRQPSASRPHFEVASAISKLCQQNANCQMSDTLDLVVGFTAYFETDEGRAMIMRLYTLLRNPALQPFLEGDGSDYGGENGVVALAEVVMNTVLAMEHPSELDALPINSLPEALRPEAQALVADLKKVLDPKLEPNILGPLKAVVVCARSSDPERDLVRMFYRLGLEADLPQFGLTEIVDALVGLRETDDRGTLLHLANTLARAVRSDEQAVTSAAKVCETMFSTRVPPGQSHSPAELALPVVADLFRDGVASEAVCAIDTLLYGCAGGAQPACEAAAVK